MPGRRRPNFRLVKVHRSYTVEEVARALGVHKNTVRAWIRRGLPVIDERRPTMIHGQDLFGFIQSWRRGSKRRCAVDEVYCVKCREPKVPAGRMVDYLPQTERLGNLQGICPDCETMINRRASRTRLDAIGAVLEITFPMADPRIRGRILPSLDCDSSGDE